MTVYVAQLKDSNSIFLSFCPAALPLTLLNLHPAHFLTIQHLYHEASKVVWNGTSIQGRDNVERFLTDLPASKHEPCSLDCQPVLPQGQHGADFHLQMRFVRTFRSMCAAAISCSVLGFACWSNNLFAVSCSSSLSPCLPAYHSPYLPLLSSPSPHLYLERASSIYISHSRRQVSQEEREDKTERTR